MGKSSGITPYAGNGRTANVMAFIPALGTTVAGLIGIQGPVTLGTATAIGGATILGGGALAVAGTKALGKALIPDIPALPSLGDIPAPPVAPTFEQAQEKTREEQLRDLRRKRAGTILTSPEGLLAPAEVTGKTLLGA